MNSGLCCDSCQDLQVLTLMSTVLEYPETELAETDCHASNFAIREKPAADPALAALEFRIETDRYGQMITSPPPAPGHGSRQSEISFRLRTLLPDGRAVSVCPVSTSEGGKAVDVARCSSEKWERFKERACFLECPEIGIEICSPSNTRGELQEKKRLYFEAGARDVWFCERDGRTRFFRDPDGEGEGTSTMVPAIPERIE